MTHKITSATARQAKDAISAEYIHPTSSVVVLHCGHWLATLCRSMAVSLGFKEQQFAEKEGEMLRAEDGFVPLRRIKGHGFLRFF